MEEMENTEKTAQPESMYDTLETRFNRCTEDWVEIIQQLSEKMKEIDTLQTLMNEIYSKRQDCVEYLQKLLVASGKYSRHIKRGFAEKYNFYKNKSQMRYTSDAAITTQIEVDLEEDYAIYDLLKVQIRTMEATLKTIDDMIFGVKERLEIYKLINGMKF